MAIFINGKRYFNPDDYVAHKGMSGVVSYHYGYAPYGSVKLPGNATHYDLDFVDFFYHSKDMFNIGYRIYMENLFKRTYGYSITHPNITASPHTISIVTDDMSHAFGLPSKMQELPIRDRYLTAFFDGLITENEGQFMLKMNAEGKNPDFLGNTKINIVDCDADEYQRVKDYVDETMNEVTRRFTNVINQCGDPSLSVNDALSTYENELKFISLIILEGVDGDDRFPGLKELCSKYKNVKGLNAYLLNALIECTEAYKDILSYTNKFTFGYNLLNRTTNVGELFIDTVVTEILYYCKESPENLKQYFNSSNTLDKFMLFIQPIILKINIDYAPSANLEEISNIISQYYPDITSNIREIMIQKYIDSKDKDSITADATFEDVLKDEFLEEELDKYEPLSSFTQQISSEFRSFCINNNLSVSNSNNYIEAYLLFFGELSDEGKWTIEHWKSLATLYLAEKKSIPELEKQLEELVELKNARGRELLEIEMKKEVPEEDDMEILLFEDEVGFNLLSQIDELESKINNKQKNIQEFEELLSNEIQFYNQILIDREIANVTDLDAEIRKFKAMNNPKLKGNTKIFPILCAFFNGSDNSFPLYDDIQEFKVYSGRNKKSVDKSYQRTYDQLFELEEMLRSELFVEDLDNAIQYVQSTLMEPISKIDLLQNVIKIMMNSYDFPYIYKKMIDSKAMIDNVFRQDFINGNPTFNLIRIAEKAKVLPRISTAFLKTPMLKRTDGAILTQFSNSGGTTQENPRETYVKNQQQMIGYFFQLPHSIDRADLVFVEPKRQNGSLMLDENRIPIFSYTHFFRNEPLSGPTTKVIAKHPDGTYDFEEFDIPPGSIVSFGTKKSGTRHATTSFNNSNFFPSAFEKYIEDKYGPGATIANIPQTERQLFEMMISGEQLAVSNYDGTTINLEKKSLQERIEAYEQHNSIILN